MHLLRQAFRRLLRERGFTVTALLTLALCLGANLTIFAVVDAVVVRALPFPEPDRLVTLYNAYPAAGAARSSASITNYFERRERMVGETFSSVAMYAFNNYAVGAEGSLDRITGLRVTPEFFATLGVPLTMGETFTDEHFAYGTDQVTVVTDAYWRNHLNADPNVLGREIIMDGLPNKIIGVLPPDFRFLSTNAQVYRPLSHDPTSRELNQLHSNSANMIARLAPGVTLEQAQAQMEVYNEVQKERDPYASLVAGAGFHTTVASLHLDHVQGVRPMLLLLQCGALFLLLIGAVNLANLMLVRASGRVRELSVRRALGAARFHIVRDVLLETLIVAALGGLTGLVVGAFGIDAIGTFGGDSLPLGAEIAFDGRLAAAAVAGSIVVGLLLALPIIWFQLHDNLAGNLQGEGRSGTATRGTQRLRHGFTVAQVALAFVLLSSAGVLGLSLQRMLKVSPGFETSQVLTGNVGLFWKNYQQPADRNAFVNRLLPELNSAPGVVAAGITTTLPFGPSGSDSVTTVEGQDSEAMPARAHYQVGVAGDYWAAMGIPLRQGRLLAASDMDPDAKVCVVDEAFARHYWPNQDPIGRRLISDVTFDEAQAFTIVGVVGAVKQDGVTDDGQHGMVYYPYPTFNPQYFNIVVRTALPPSTAAPTVRQIVRGIDPMLPVADLQPMTTVVDDTLVTRRSPVMLAGIFAAVALLLAAIGTYGVLAYAVGQRRREIGVRMALGAVPSQILQQFLQLGTRLLAAGLTLGVLGSWAASRALQSVLFEIGGFHLGVVAGTAIVMSLAVLVSALLPSQRAARVSPIEALRDD